MFSNPLLFVVIDAAVMVKVNLITVVFLRFFSQIQQVEFINQCIVQILFLLLLNGQLQFGTLTFDTITVEKLDFVDDILGQRLAVPLPVKFPISFNNIGGHLLDLCNTATQANMKNVRGNNTTRLFMTLVDLSLQWGRQRHCPIS
jgi:hypothetical protein